MVHSNNRYSVILFAVFAILLLVPLQAVAALQWQWITPQRVSSMVREGSGLWLVDVRNETAFTQGHIEGAIHIPAAALANKRLPKGKVFVLADDSLGCREGREAAEALLKNGQDKVFVLEGGIPAWQAEGLPVAGRQGVRNFLSVMPDDLTWAADNKITVRVLDLRDKEEQGRGPVPQAVPVEGKDLTERLEKARSMAAALDRKGLAGRLEKPVPVVLVFPTAVDARSSLERAFRGHAGVVRFIEGGYAAWAAKPDKNLSAVGVCPTCPGSAPGGKK